MKFRIFKEDSSDYLDIEADTLEEVSKQAHKETERRGWKNPYSVKM